MEGLAGKAGEAFAGLCMADVVPLLASGLVPALTDALGAWPLVPMAAGLLGGFAWLMTRE